MPFIVRWGDGTAAGSKIAPGSISDQLIVNHDWVATMYELTGQSMSEDQAMDSASLMPILWEWVADWYRPDAHARNIRASAVENPRGPADSHDPAEPGIPKRVQKGGSFLRTDQYCSRYEPGLRGAGAIDTGSNHVGFRCVVDAAAVR